MTRKRKRKTPNYQKENPTVSAYAVNFISEKYSKLIMCIVKESNFFFQEYYFEEYYIIKCFFIHCSQREYILVLLDTILWRF